MLPSFLKPWSVCFCSTVSHALSPPCMLCVVLNALDSSFSIRSSHTSSSRLDSRNVRFTAHTLNNLNFELNFLEIFQFWMRIPNCYQRFFSPHSFPLWISNASVMLHRVTVSCEWIAKELNCSVRVTGNQDLLLLIVVVESCFWCFS